MSGTRGGPSTYTFRISSEGMQEFVQELGRLSQGSEQANAAIQRLVQSSPQLASSLLTQQDATARAAQRATELRQAQERGAAAAQASVAPMRRASDALGDLEGKTQAARRATADMRGALDLLGATNVSTALGPVAGFVGNLADLFGTASLAAGRFGGALSASVPFLAPLAAGIGLAGAAAVALSSAYDATADNARRAKEAEEAYRDALQRSNSLLRNNTELMENSFSARRQEAIAAVELARAIERENLARANDAASRAAGTEQRLEESVTSGRAARGQVQAGIDRARATQTGLASIAQVVSDRMAELDVRLTQLQMLRYDRPADVPLPTDFRRPGGGGGGGGGGGRAAPALVELRDQESAEALAVETIRARLAANADRQRQATKREEAQSLQRREREAERSAERVTQFLADGFTNAFLDGERGFEGMLESFRRTAIATPIRIFAEAVITPAVEGITGALGAGGGAGGIAELFGLAQAGRQLAGLTGIGGVGGAGGVTGFLNTSLFTPAFGAETLTLGGAVGGIGGGFALGNFTGGLTAGNSRARQLNGQIGAGIGAVGGTIIGGPLGGMIGGAAGGAIGGLIGPGRGFSGGDALIGVAQDGALEVLRFAGKNFDESEALMEAARQQVAALNAAMSQVGLRFAAGIGGSDPGAFAFAIGGGEAGGPRDLMSAVRGTGLDQLRASDDRLFGALQRGNPQSLEQAIAIAQQVQAFGAAIDAIAKAARDAEDPIGAIRRSYDDQIAVAERLGFGLETLVEAQRKAVNAAQAQIDAEKARTEATAEAERQRAETERQRLEAQAEAERQRAEIDRQRAAAQAEAEREAVRRNFRLIADNDNAQLARQAQASGSRLAVLTQRGQAFEGGFARQREDLEGLIASTGLPEEWRGFTRERLEETLRVESEALQREWTALLRDRRVALDGITGRALRANADATGDPAARQSADLFDLDLRARSEIDSVGLGLRELGFAAEEVAAEVARLTGIYDQQREAVVKSYAEQQRLEAEQRRADAARQQAARDRTVQGFIEQVTFGGLSTLSPEAQAQSARRALGFARDAVADGATQAELEELVRVAQATLPVIRQNEGITEGFGALVSDLSAVLRAAAPGGDAAGLAAVVEGTDRVTEAVYFTADRNAAILSEIRDGLARQGAQIAALQLRAA